MRLPRPKTRKKRMFTRLVLQIYQETWRNTSCVCLSLQLGKSLAPVVFLVHIWCFFLLVEQSEMPEGISRTRLMSILRGYGEFPAKYRSVAGRLSALGYRTNTHQALILS